MYLTMSDATRNGKLMGALCDPPRRRRSRPSGMGEDAYVQQLAAVRSGLRSARQQADLCKPDDAKYALSYARTALNAVPSGPARAVGEGELAQTTAYVYRARSDKECQAGKDELQRRIDSASSQASQANKAALRERCSPMALLSGQGGSFTECFPNWWKVAAVAGVGIVALFTIPAWAHGRGMRR